MSDGTAFIKGHDCHKVGKITVNILCISAKAYVVILVITNWKPLWKSFNCSNHSILSLVHRSYPPDICRMNTKCSGCLNKRKTKLCIFWCDIVLKGVKDNMYVLGLYEVSKRNAACWCGGCMETWLMCDGGQVISNNRMITMDWWQRTNAGLRVY